ncbi:MAG: TIGR03905 family TSCPD domain-containing protein [Eubacteriales bacterium]
MKDYVSYEPHGVCSRHINLEIDDNVITDASFVGGCSGNTQGVCALVKGMTVDEAIKRLKGIRCGAKATSCPDQLADALIEYQKRK